MEDSKAIWPGWETTRLIGRGSFGSVYEISRQYDNITEKAALKVISIPQNPEDIEEMYSEGYDDESITNTYLNRKSSIVSEYTLMKELYGSANVVNCDDYKAVAHNDGIGWDILIKMELLTPLLKTLPDPIPESLVLKIASDICSALVLCAKYDIVHRDIKPQNIFLSKHGNYKLGDFGIAKTMERVAGGTRAGTPKYMAPEVYNNQPYGALADIYSLGLVMYWLLNDRRMPFVPQTIKANEQDAALARRLSGEAIPAPRHGSDKLKQIVLKACAFSPTERFSSAQEMLSALQKLSFSSLDTAPVAIMSPPATDISVDPQQASEDKTVLLAHSNSDRTEYLRFDETVMQHNQTSPTSSSSRQEAAYVLQNQLDSEKTTYLPQNQAAKNAIQPDVSKQKQVVSNASKPASAENKPPQAKPSASTQPKSKRKKRVLPWIVVLILIILLAVLGFSQCSDIFQSAFPQKTEPDDSLSAPNVVGMSQKTAVRALERYGLVVQITTQYSDSVEEGLVLEQDPAAGKPISAGDTVTIVVSYKSKPISVLLDACGGQIAQDHLPVYPTLAYGTLPTPTRTGYTFDGWYTAADGGTRILSDSTVESEEDHTLYARWSPMQFTVTFQSDGGSVAPDQIQVTYGSVYGELPEATKTGFAFIGWFTQATGGDKILPDTIVALEEDITLYAQWSEAACTVTLQPNGGNLAETSLTVNENAPYGTLPTPTRTGYTFDGWYTAQTRGTRVTEVSIVPAGDHTLYAQWSAKTITVKLDANGGNGTTQISVTYGKTYGSLPTPTRSGHSFDGWYTAKTGGSKVTGGTSVTNANTHTLYARWIYNSSSPTTPASYAVTFNANGGSVSPSSRTYTKGDTYGTLPTPTRSGYTFDGWYTAQTGGSKVTSSSTVQSKNHTLYAHWTKQATTPTTYTVTFNGNGGSVSTPTKTYTQGSTYGSLPTPTRYGYTFDGWYTSQTGGSKVTSSSTVQSKNHTLYAHWTEIPKDPNTITVTFNANGGFVSISSKTYAKGSTYGELPIPTRAGFKFDGWCTTPSGNGTIFSANTTVRPEDHTLYARWSLDLG